MKRRNGKLRSLLWMIAAALLLVALIGALVTVDLRSRSRGGITLPEPGSSAADPGTESAVEGFAIVTTDNAPGLVASMERPVRYHQTVAVETVSGDRTGTAAAEIWVSGSVWKIQQTERGQTRHILTDGETAYLWYGDDTRNVRSVMLPPDLGPDDLMGQPTYETIAGLPAGAVAEARYVTPEDLDGAPCLYAAADEGQIRTEYWVDLSTGLLRRAEIRKDGETIRRLEQSGLELPAADDAALLRAMQLPGGTAPFTAEEETQLSQ